MRQYVTAGYNLEEVSITGVRVIGEWALHNAIENIKISIKENESVTAHTHRDSTQPYYVSAPSIWRYMLKRWLRQLSLHQRCASHATTSQDETCRGFKRNTKTSVTLHQKQSLSIQCTSIILTLNIEQCNVILHLTSQWFHYKVSITTTNDGYTMHLPGWFVLKPARNHNWYPPLDMKSCLIRHSIPELCGSS